MTHPWSKTVFPIAALFSFRMLGLFMLIPVFTVYATKLDGATPTLIGFALGSYGLSQGLLQIPFGMLSDRFGRKPIITLGLIFFAAGSLLGACTHSIYVLLLARILQGMGAIGSVLIALMADLTTDQERTKAMAVIGVTIGVSFSLSMVISPSIAHHFGLPGIFYFTTLLALLGLLLLHARIPTPKKMPFHMDTEVNPQYFKKVLTNLELRRLNVGIFCQHFILTSTFFVLPLLLQHQTLEGHLAVQWHFYLPLMVFAFLAMVPVIMFAEKKRQMKPVFLCSIAITTLSQALLSFSHPLWFWICTLMFFYFVAFNILEASLPSLISRQASSESKGTAMGIYSSAQFLGIFFGGAFAGLLYAHSLGSGIFLANTLVGALWFCIALPMNPECYQTTLILSYSPKNKASEDALSQRLRQLEGVIQVAFSKEEGVVYLQIDKSAYRVGSADKLLA